MFPSANPWNTIFKQRGRVFAEPHEDMGKIAHRLQSTGAPTLLDLGSGSGRHGVYFARRGFSVCGLDPSAEGIALARHWLAEEGLAADLQRGSMTDPLPYPQACVDAVLAVQVIHPAILATIRRGVHAIARVLRPGGFVFVTVPQLKNQAQAFQEVELTQIPDNPLVYNRFSGLNSGDTRGFDTALAATRNWNVPCGALDISCQDYRKSHGYVRYGDYYPGMGGPGGWTASGTREAINATDDGIFFRKCDSCANFNAFAKRPLVIDKRGENGRMQFTQNYNCGAGGCVVSTTNVSFTASGRTTTLAPGGPVTQGPGNNARVYNTDAVSLGSSRIEGLLIHQLYLESCQPGTC